MMKILLIITSAIILAYLTAGAVVGFFMHKTYSEFWRFVLKWPLYFMKNM